MRILKRNLFIFGLLFVFLVILGYFGVNFFLHRMNVSFVFYSPGKLVSLQKPSEMRGKRYGLMPDTQIRNIVLFIGDGMGLDHLAATRLHFLGPDGRLNIERMPVTGLVTNHAIDALITDSAASATALATGVKTRNSWVGVDSSGNSRLTILEAARDAGLATGLVTSTQLTDATPAAFATHVGDRGRKSEIALQLIKSKVNVLFGEGEYFYPKIDPRSKRTDDVNPIDFARQLNYTFVDTEEELINASGKLMLGIFEDITVDRMKPDLNRNSNSLSLAELTTKAIELLSPNEDGFFLLVEEEGVDLGSHVNRPEYFLRHLKIFDDAVKVGLDFALRDAHTLVIVTSDHETGGLNIIGGSYTNRELELEWDTDRHTGQPVPLFAFGPYAVRFTGLKDNTEIPMIISELLELEAFSRESIY